MAYNKKEWFSGETITASNLNHIEDGIDTLDKGATNLTNNLNSEIQTRTTETTTLKSRVDQIVAPTGEAPSAAEVTDARVGADGTTYDSVGNAIRTQVADLKSTIDEITGTYKNLFNPAYFVNAGWEKDGVEYYGDAFSLNNTYGTSATPYPVVGFENGSRYTIAFDAKTDGNVETTGNGFRVSFGYSDGTSSRITVSNNVTSYNHYVITSDAGKSVTAIWFGYGSSGYNIWHIKNVILVKGPSEIAYIPYRIAVDYKAREDIESLTGHVNTFEQRYKETLPSPNVNIIEPNGFTWIHSPVKGKIQTNYAGQYKCNFDIASYDVSSQGVTYYVDPNGAESNNGLTPESAFRKMETAYNMADCSCIILADGVYRQGTNLSNVTITKNIAIKAKNGSKPIITTDSGSVFTLYEDNVYSATRSSCARVLDMSTKNEYGDFLEYTKYSSVSDVIANAGSWAHIDRVLYVHCFDDRVPDDQLLLTIVANNLFVQGGATLYLEGLTVISGSSPLKVSNTAEDLTPRVFAKNCDFLYSESTGNDVVMLQGVELSIMQHCRAMYGMKDGFNYHAQNGTISKAIEIDCIGALNGNVEDSNDQGSTIHDGGSIIRIACKYFNNIGSNVADEASESWNVGCVLYEPKAPNSGQNGNFYAYSDSKMWIDSCIMFGNAHYNIISANDGTTEIYLRNNKFDNGTKSVPIYGTTPIYY